ncbi:SOS response-associated peptidase [Bifidobacterium amazonense]|uniref:Abasic site processing protein n=1 Tax=Bifidobacterium amazonense TaxID=2809027 RepID=A0ABS9VWZ6_9BIFI|nr:SOS response-associated peptidase [Bifidobacterium amazonense]MCH9276625.1 SOS response-associated peptidase [Bifidobacterium amazonense]
MCRRFVLDLDWEALAAGLDIADDNIDRDDLPEPSYNMAPGHTIAVVAQGRDGARHLAGARWSLVPAWSRTDVLPYPTYNARVESIASKPTFAASARSMRALIPANGYYEWKGGTNGRPFYFHADDDHALYMAGLFSWWRRSLGAPWLLTATIVTCPATDGPASVHDRMPLLVPDDFVGPWLDRSSDCTDMLDDLRKQGTELSRSLRFHEVAPLPDPAETVHNNDPKLIRPISRNTGTPALLF